MKSGMAAILPFDLSRALPLDFSATNPDLLPDSGLDLTNTALFSAYVFGKLQAAGAQVGIGGYNEHRVIYRRSAHFGDVQAEPREIHLGIDLWAEAGTPVYAPKAGVVHSFADNANFGDYGPTIILQHDVEGAPVFSLYGHLSRASLEGLYEGKVFNAGDKLAEIGPFPENGDWPPHLHFQLMTDMLGHRGDFPGVCSLTDRARFLQLCPDPAGWL
ncbi:peptidoglycan DD-metalloendopeptidase family protein [Rudanella paleaurantiibacter]|uniref:Peptidoglycan DD-metalloendopeptidase family protein n=2 Tax=Rudanella paleaurantiibacter TaxID=2614655 RepID=A0A7J5TWQ9_9BACT|nr:peptidoglycan DD-metalloendopeptidase family protein [Rudanella paleaurantiibacter]